MAFSSLVALPSFLFENDNFLIFLIFEDFGGNRSAFDGWGTKSWFSVIDNHEYLIEFNLITFVGVGKTIHEQFVTLFDSELTPLCFDCSYHECKDSKNHFWKLLASVILALIPKKFCS